MKSEKNLNFFLRLTEPQRIIRGENIFCGFTWYNFFNAAIYISTPYTAFSLQKKKKKKKVYFQPQLVLFDFYISI